MFGGRSPTLGRLRMLKVGDVELDLDGYRIVVRGTTIRLPRKEFVILRQLMENAGRVLTRRALLYNSWGPDRIREVRHYLPIHIRRIRKRIESDTDRPTRIRIARNVGYVFDFPQHD